MIDNIFFALFSQVYLFKKSFLALELNSLNKYLFVLSKFIFFFQSIILSGFANKQFFLSLKTSLRTGRFDAIKGVLELIYSNIFIGDIHSAVLIFWENPLFGTGPATYYVEKLKLIEAGLIPLSAKMYTGPHSQLFNSLYEQGFFGAFMVYSIYAAFIFHCRSHLSNNKALATSGILLAFGFMDFGISEVIWDINNAGVFFTVMMALIAGKLSHAAKS